MKTFSSSFSFYKKLISILISILLGWSAIATASAASEFLTYANELGDAQVIPKQTSERAYRLDMYMSRAEAVKIAMKLAKKDPIVPCPSSTLFRDVTSNLGSFCGYIASAADLGVITTAKEYFRPFDAITRAEMIKIFMAAKKITPSNDDTVEFYDVPWYFGGDLGGYVDAAVAAGIIINTSGYFRPNSKATHGEIYKVASKVLELDSASGLGGAILGNTKIAIADFAFSPTSLTIKKGTKVTWKNSDNSAHTVTFDNFGSDTLYLGDSYSVLFDQAGTYSYSCAFHPMMTGVITVTE